MNISIHALLAESDTLTDDVSTGGKIISIHALLAESDLGGMSDKLMVTVFLSTLSLRRATYINRGPYHIKRFLSTLSLRRATHYDNYNLHCVEISIHALLAESDVSRKYLVILGRGISIHALLAESDPVKSESLTTYLISIHALLAESDPIFSKIDARQSISIHALLAESDVPQCHIFDDISGISIHALLAESDSKSAQNSGALLRI